MSSTAKLGVFMLAALTVLALFILKIEKIELGGQGRLRRVPVEFPSVAGLDEKSPVRLAGVRVGLAETIELRDDRALVTLALDPGVELREGAKATLRSIGLLGDLYIDLDPGPRGAPPLAPGEVLPGVTPASFDEVLQKASDIGGDVKGVTASLRSALAGPEGEQRIADILDNIRSVSADIRALVVANRDQVDSTVSNFRDVSQTLREELPVLAEKLNRLADGVQAVVDENRDNLEGSLANMRDLSERLKTSADNLNAITSKIASGEGTIGKLVHDDTTVDNLNSALNSVESGVASLRNTLGRAERWRLDVGLRSESLPRIDDTRTGFGIDLHTTDRRFFRVGINDSPQGRRRESTETITTTLADGSSTVLVENKVKTTDAFTINAQAGYRLRDTLFRAGLFESTGGVGVDQLFLADRAGVSLEAYDWGRDVKAPHLRLEGRWFFNRNIYAFAGWDDPRWSPRSSAIIGAGVTWTDEDLKYLLGTAASAAK